MVAGGRIAAPVTWVRAVFRTVAVVMMCRVGGRAAFLSSLIIGIAAREVAADPNPIQIHDTPGDAVARRSDPGGDGPLDAMAHPPIDLLQITIGKWAPSAPQTDLFTGSFLDGGRFLRMDLTLAGLVNPPGVADPLAFGPFAWGAHPVFGFVEIDMDRDVQTGGELDSPQYRYLGNVVRFGGRPTAARFANRVAIDDSAFDGDFLTPPFVDRHGEEFHLAFLGELFAAADITEQAGDADMVFEEGETWNIRAPLFHRAHGFEPFSLAEGGAVPGEYSPVCDVQFQHDPAQNVTQVSLVFPLNRDAAGQMRGEPPEPYDHDPSNQASVEEALRDLRDSAAFVYQYPTGLPEQDIIARWKDKEPDDFIDPRRWDITVLLGTSFTAPNPAGEFFVWTDVCPDVVCGDVNGGGIAGALDLQAIEQYIAEHDASDGILDGRVVIQDFATDFSVYDVNHDGIVDAADTLLSCVTADADGDGDIDLCDFGHLQTCFSGSGIAHVPGACGLHDTDYDGDVDESDVERFEVLMTGP